MQVLSLFSLIHMMICDILLVLGVEIYLAFLKENSKQNSFGMHFFLKKSFIENFLASGKKEKSKIDIIILLSGIQLERLYEGRKEGKSLLVFT